MPPRPSILTLGGDRTPEAVQRLKARIAQMHNTDKEAREKSKRQAERRGKPLPELDEGVLETDGSNPRLRADVSSPFPTRGQGASPGPVKKTKPWFIEHPMKVRDKKTGLDKRARKTMPTSRDIGQRAPVEAALAIATVQRELGHREASEMAREYGVQRPTRGHHTKHRLTPEQWATFEEEQRELSEEMERNAELM